MSYNRGKKQNKKNNLNVNQAKNGFVSIVREHKVEIANNLLTSGEFWTEEIGTKLAKAASYHVVALEGTFRDFFKKYVLEDQRDNVNVSYIREKMDKALDFMDKADVMFTPIGKLKEGETLEFKGSFV